MTNLANILLVVLLPVVLSQSSKPHFVVILVDDLGWNDVGYQGSDQIKTPNIDALAYSGMVLSRHYVLPTCTPSRTALLTGRYPIRTGMQGFPLKAGENRSLPLSFKLKPEWLRELGYRTHIIGKWHLGYETYNHVPNHRGFETFFGFYNGYTNFYKYDYNQSLDSVSTRYEGRVFRGYDLHRNDNIHRPKKQVYATTRFANRARDVIHGHNSSEPLYLYLSHAATHTGIDEAMSMQVPENADVNKTYPHIKHYGRRGFAGCLEELDNSVGTVMEALRKKNMLGNSVILIMSDNGAHTVSIDMAPNWGSNWPLRGTKFTMFDGGVRGVALIWSPLLPKGHVNQGFMHISDWLPTFYSAAGGNVENLGEIDGVDQWEALKQGTTINRNSLLLNIDEKSKTEGVIINDRWKIVRGGLFKYANYDLHWGKEENLVPNPEYNITAVLTSQTGTIIRSLPQYKDILEPKQMAQIRDKATVRCKSVSQSFNHVDGTVLESSDFYCQDYCVFDILNDPCELHNLELEEIVNLGKRHLNEYRKGLIPQKSSSVDERSNPELFGGVWVPWKLDACETSKEFPQRCAKGSLP